MAQPYHYPNLDASSRDSHSRIPVSPLLPSQRLSLLRTNIAGDAHELNPQLVSPIMSRSPSVASDSRYSGVSGNTGTFPSNPSNVKPAPAYVAAFGAAQVVSEHQATRKGTSSSDDDTTQPAKDDVQFSPSALTLVNAFLDQLLYSFLSAAKSTNLQALRPAVTDILKHKLARDSIANAEEELQELLAGGEEEEEEEEEGDEQDKAASAKDVQRKWDLELVWKRTRLRVMVYMRLGEMEDDDEDRYVKEQELFAAGSEKRRFSSTTGLVSWSAAIFLTSVLEHVAEQTLQVAGAAAFSRVRRHGRTQQAATSTATIRPPDQVVIEEQDAERVALNPALGRLWRTWRKTLRANVRPPTPTERGRMNHLTRSKLADESTAAGQRDIKGSAPSASHAGGSATGADDDPDAQYPEDILASNIPLPMADAKRDVDEIEAPGLAKDPDADETVAARTTAREAARRRSLTDLMLARPTSVPAHADQAVSDDASDDAASKPTLRRQRSNSLPAPYRGSMAMNPSALHEAVNDRAPADDGTRDQDDAATGAERKDGAERSDTLTGTREAQPPVEGWMDKSKTAFVAGVAGVAGAVGLGGGAAAVAAKHETEQETADKAAAPTVSDEGNADNIDRRKSLADMKSLLAGEGNTGAVDGPRPQASVVSPEHGKSKDRPVSAASDQSFTLGDKEKGEVIPQKPIAQRQHMPSSEKDGLEDEPDSSIGVAKTSDYSVASASTPPPVSSAEPLQAINTRDPADSPRAEAVPPHPAEAELDGRSSVPRSKYSPRPAEESVQALAPQATLGAQPGPENSTQQSQNQQNGLTQAALRESLQRASGQNVTVASTGTSSPGPSEHSHRRTTSRSQAEQQATLQRHEPSSASREKNSPGQVVEHPAVAVVQRKISVSDGRNGKNDTSGLTSANIRGPEDFDMFIRSDEMVKYTLTPESVRDEPTAHAASLAQLSGKTTTDGPAASRNDNALTRSDSRTARSQTSKPAHGNRPDVGTRSEKDEKAEKRRSISRPPPTNTTVSKKSGLMPREPRVMTESTRDFADFIRSTRPNMEPEVYLLATNQSAVSLHSVRSGNSTSRSQSLASKSDAAPGSIPPVPVIPSKAKSSMQPRAAKASGNEHSSDLIAFIRDGPRENGQHRISRSVAPFRSTMDSDQFENLTNSTRPGRSSDLKPSADLQQAASTNSFSSITMPSARTSANSRSAWANEPSDPAPAPAVHPAWSGQPQRLNSMTRPASPDGPRRKQYRNKDPYAINLDDEDDDDDSDLLTALPPRGKRNEESLADFLRNAEPPSDNGPRPIASASSLAQAREIMERARANNTNGARASSAMDGAPSRTRTPGSGSSSGPSGRQLPHSATSYSMTDQLASRMEARPSGGKAGDRLGLNTGSNSRDLADFLRGSGPSSTATAPAPVIGKGQRGRGAGPDADGAKKGKKEKRSMGDFFFRRSKSTKNRNTYLDMP